jgi:integrase/recombinase XerD
VCGQFGTEKGKTMAETGRLFKRGGVWWVSIYMAGAEVRRSGGTYNEAKRLLEKLRKEKLTGRFPRMLGEVLEAYRRNLLTRGKAATVHSYECSQRILERHFGESFLISDLSTQKLLEFASDRSKDDDLTAPTVNRPLRNLKAALRFAVDSGDLEKIPCRIRLLKETRKNPQILTKEEFKHLLASTKHDDARVAIVLAYQCGLRHDEILHIRLKDIRWVENPIIRLASRSDWTTKTHCERDVVMTAAAIRYVKQCIKEHGFTDNPESPLLYRKNRTGCQPYNNLFMQVRDAFKAADLYDRDLKSGLHMLRRSFASHLLGGGVDLKTVCDLGGWSTIEACQRYLTSTSELKLNAVSVLDFDDD